MPNTNPFKNRDMNLVILKHVHLADLQHLSAINRDMKSDIAPFRNVGAKWAAQELHGELMVFTSALVPTRDELDAERQKRRDVFGNVLAIYCQKVMEANFHQRGPAEEQNHERSGKFLVMIYELIQQTYTVDAPLQPLLDSIFESNFRKIDI